MINLIIKDIKNILYDKKSLMTIVIMPIVLMSILGMALQGMFSNESDSGIMDIHIGVVKQYDFELEQEKFKNVFNHEIADDIIIEYNPEDVFFQEFLGSENLEFIKFEEVSLEAGEKLLDNNKIAALVLLPNNYIYNSYMNMVMPNRTKINIQLMRNPEMDFSAGIVEQVIEGFINTMNSKIARQIVKSKISISNGLDVSLISETVKAMQQENNQISIQTKGVTGSDMINSFQYYSAAIMAMFLLYSASIGAIALYEEKTNHTLQRQYVSGNRLLKMSISNFFRILLLVVIQSSILIVYSSFALGVDWGDLKTIVLALAFSSFAVAGIGMFVASLTIALNDTKVANIFQFAFVQFMALIGGSFVPVEVLPKTLQKMSVISINSNVLGLYINGMYHRAFSENIEYITFLSIFGILFIVLSILIIKGQKKEAIA